MADISHYQKIFQNAELEDLSDGMEDEDQQGEGDASGDKDPEPGLTPVDRLLQHAISPKVASRQMVGKLLINIFQNAVKYDFSLNVDDVFEPLQHIIHDNETSVRSSLVECLPHVALICQEPSFDLFGDKLISRILQIVLIYIRDPDNQVRQDAQAALRTLLERELLSDEQVHNDVCNVIIELSREDCPELQTLALTLMTKVNPYIGDELTEKLFLDRYLELCNNEGFFVRRVCASIMGEFCTIMSKETVYNKLLQTYANLCLDTVWGVRKTSVDVMMSVARCVPLTLRRQVLSKLLVKHLRDDSRWVRRSAFEILGPFISTFAKQFHELIYDHKGELVLVHENKRGNPRFNVVPVAKASDILTQNLSDSDSYGCHKSVSLSLQREFTSRATYENLSEIKEKNHKLDHTNKRLKEQVDARNKTNKADDYENFNLFQYYYDPPDMPLDPELVNSIANDNESAKTEDNEIKDSDRRKLILNKKARNSESEQDKENVDTLTENKNQDSNENIENEEAQQADSENKNNDINKNTEQQQPQESKENEHDVMLQLKKFDEQSKEEEEDSEESVNNEGYEIVWHPEGGSRKFVKKSQSSEKTESNKSEPAKKKSEEHRPNKTYNLNDTVDISNTSSSSLDNQQITLPTNITFQLDDESEDDDEIVPRILVDYFVSMADQENYNSYTDIGPDLDYHCAFSFPAVVLTLGKDNWHRLKDAYQRLAGAVAWKVRSTLASSIHEIAIIIEQEYATRDLVPIFNGFIKDLDEVRIGALKHFATFLKVLTLQDRVQYLPKLNDFLITDSKWNWRLKEELVKQLSEIIYLYQPDDVATYVATLLLHLMQDRVAAVRQEALSAISRMLAYLGLSWSDPLAIAMVQEMRDLLIANGADKWIIRQTYALVCSKLIQARIITGEVFVKELLPYLLELARDKVPNVRLVVARTLAVDVKNPYFLEMDALNSVKLQLCSMICDSDRDVRDFACKEVPFSYIPSKKEALIYKKFRTRKNRKDRDGKDEESTEEQ